MAPRVPLSLSAALAGAYTTCGLDLTLASLDQGVRYALLWPILTGAALLLVAYLLLHLLLCRGLRRLLPALKGEREFPIAVGIAVLLAVPPLALSTGAIVPGDNRAERLPAVFLLVLTLLSATGAGFLAAFARRDERWRASLGSLSTSLPLIAVALALVSFVARGRGTRTGSPVFLLACLLLVLLWLFGARLLRSSRARDRVFLSLGIGAVLAALGGGIGFLAGDPWIKRDGPSAPAEEPGVRHVLLLTVDTLRRDAVSAYAEDGVTPNIDRLAKDSVLFRNARSTGPWTLPGFASLLTGRSAHVHKALHLGDRLPGALKTMAERFRSAGYRTASIGYNFFLASDPRDDGLQAGIAEDLFLPRTITPVATGHRVLSSLFPRKTGRYITTSEIAEEAIRWIEAHREEPSFLWIHFFDPHVPYAPPDDYVRASGYPPGSRFRFCADRVRQGKLRLDPQEVARAHALYLAEVRHVDDRIGEILGTLKREGIYDETLIVFASDHGEEFWEHQGLDHGHSLKEELLAVPLLVKLPDGEEAGQEVSVPVTIDRVLPTILDVTRVRPGAEASLAPVWRGEDTARGPLFFTGLLVGEDRDAVVFDHYKYIRYHFSPRERLFDLAADPEELRDLSTSRPEVAARGRELLEEHRRAARVERERLRLQGGSLEIDPESRRTLESLGYVK